MKKALLTSMAILASALVLVSCSKSNDGNGGSNNNCSGTPKSFVTDVNPIVQTFCNQPNCHASGSTNGPGPITNYNQVFNARGLIRTAIESGFMPQNATLTAAQKNAILCWIDSGAPNN